MDQEICWIPINETTSSTSFFASQYKEKNCLTNVYGNTFESFASLRADVLMPYFELPTEHTFFRFTSIGAPISSNYCSVKTCCNTFYLSSTESVVCNCSIILHIYFYITLLTKDFFYKLLATFSSRMHILPKVLQQFLFNHKYISHTHCPSADK
jgi:hypothetical protein